MKVKTNFFGISIADADPDLVSTYNDADPIGIRMRNSGYKIA